MEIVLLVLAVGVGCMTLGRKPLTPQDVYGSEYRAVELGGRGESFNEEVFAKELYEPNTEETEDQVFRNGDWTPLLPTLLQSRLGKSMGNAVTGLAAPMVKIRKYLGFVMSTAMGRPPISLPSLGSFPGIAGIGKIVSGVKGMGDKIKQGVLEKTTAGLNTIKNKIRSAASGVAGALPGLDVRSRASPSRDSAFQVVAGAEALLQGPLNPTEKTKA